LFDHGCCVAFCFKTVDAEEFAWKLVFGAKDFGAKEFAILVGWWGIT